MRHALAYTKLDEFPVRFCTSMSAKFDERLVRSCASDAKFDECLVRLVTSYAKFDEYPVRFGVSYAKFDEPLVRLCASCAKFDECLVRFCKLIRMPNLTNCPVRACDFVCQALTNVSRDVPLHVPNLTNVACDLRRSYAKFDECLVRFVRFFCQI